HSEPQLRVPQLLCFTVVDQRSDINLSLLSSCSRIFICTYKNICFTCMCVRMLVYLIILIIASFSLISSCYQMDLFIIVN
ncbi:hypothetical protein CISIN_1g048072mg, partial [Citrus sinensis]